MAVDNIFAEIKKLSRPEREKLRLLLDAEEDSPGERNEAFARSAGAWSDFDAESFLKDIYKHQARAQYHGLTVLTNNKKHYEKVLNPRKIISLET
ncbi:MAG: hypothetical protein AB1556_09415 [Bacillota bacterium]